MPESTNKTIDRTMKLLESFANEGISLNVAEISRFLDVSRVTAQAIVNSLEQANYIERDPESGKYSFGFKMFAIGNRYLYRYPFLHAAQKHVHHLSTEKKLKINVSVLKPNGQLVILLTKDISLVPYMAVGSLVPGNVSASSKIQFAFLPEQKRDEILEKMEYKAMTPQSVTDPAKFRADLDLYREQGYATEMDELVIGRGCIAAPVFDITGSVIAAVSISDHVDRLRREFDSLQQDVIMLAKMISGELGYWA